MKAAPFASPSSKASNQEGEMRARFARGMTAAFMVAGCAAGNSASTATFEELRTSYQLGDEQLVATAPLPFAATQVRFGYENGVIEASFATSEGPERAIEFFKMLSPEFLRQVQRQTRAALDAPPSQDAKGFYTGQKTAAHLFQPPGRLDPSLVPWLAGSTSED